MDSKQIERAQTAINDLDDFARMSCGVDAFGPRKVLVEFISSVEAATQAANELALQHSAAWESLRADVLQGVDGLDNDQVNTVLSMIDHYMPDSHAIVAAPVQSNSVEIDGIKTAPVQAQEPVTDKQTQDVYALLAHVGASLFKTLGYGSHQRDQKSKINDVMRAAMSDEMGKSLLADIFRAPVQPVVAQKNEMKVAWDLANEYQQKAEKSEAAFKNFHRAMCSRFGYVHDEVDWKRDQVSLEEYIAAKVLGANDLAVIARAGTLMLTASEHGMAPILKSGDDSPNRTAYRETGNELMAIFDARKMVK